MYLPESAQNNGSNNNTDKFKENTTLNRRHEVKFTRAKFPPSQIDVKVEKGLSYVTLYSVKDIFTYGQKRN